MSKYDQMLKKQESEADGKIWNRYGFSEVEWSALTTEQREIHYNRQKVCDHPYEYKGIETEPGVFYKGDDWSLREHYSFDPYFHTTHLMPHDPKNKKCDCQICVGKFGVPQGKWSD